MTTSAEAFAALAALPFGEIFLAIEVQPRDPVTGLAVPGYVTSAPLLFTEPDDTPPSIGFRHAIIKGWKISRRLTQRGIYTGPSTFNVANFRILNADGSFSSWLDLDWNGQPIVVKAGGRRQADGSPYPYSLYETIFTGVTEDLIARADATLEIIVRGRAVAFDKPVVTDFYRGYGGAVRSALGTERISSIDIPALDLTSGLALEWIGVMDEAPPIEGCFFRRTKDYGLTVDSSRLLGFIHDGGTVVKSSYAVPVGVPILVACSVAPDGAGEFDLTWVAGSTAEDLAVVGTAHLTSLPMAGGGLRFSKLNGNAFKWTIWEARIWSASRTLQQLIDQADAPIADPSAESDLVEVWKFGDGVDLKALGAKGVLDLTLDNATLTWVSSLEGDDPEQFGGGPIGQSKPDMLGTVSAAVCTAVDSQRHDFQWSRSTSADLRRLLLRGAPLVPDETITSAVASAFVFDAAQDSIFLNPAFLPPAHRFVPSQADPARAGQQLQVAGTVLNDGTYQVAAIKASGFQVVLEAIGGGAPGLMTELAPSGTSIFTPAAEVQYTYDLATSTVRTIITPDGELIVDATGQVSGAGGGRASDLFEILFGVAPDTTQLIYDPKVGIFIPPGSGVTLKEVLDRLARSCFGWWVEDRLGSYRVGNFSAPGGATPVATIAGSRLQLLDSSIVAPIVGRIKSIKPIRPKIPSWQLRCGYDRTWSIQDASALVGSVTPAERKRLSEPYRFAVRTYASIRSRWPSSAPLDPFETYITNRAEAEAFLDLAAPLFKEPRGWFDVQVAGLPFLALDLNAPVWLEHPEPSLRLTGGVPGRIFAMTADTSSNLVTMEVNT